MLGLSPRGAVATRPMRVATIVAPGKSRLELAEVPEPGPGEVRVRLEGSGVCASNLSAWEGQPWFEYPFPAGAPGHEGWGFVDAVGDGVGGLREGARVALLSSRAYAEYDLARADEVVPLPSALDGQPFPGEPLGCAFNILERSRIAPGETVAIVGAGFLGVLLTRLSARAGAQVIALSRRSSALETARDFGASVTIPLDDQYGAIETVREVTGGSLCGRVIECTGKQWPLDIAAEITAERGTLVIAGYHQDGPRQVNMQLWNWRGLDVVNAHERDPRVYVTGIRRAIEAVVSGELDPSPLYTHVYPLDRLSDALDATRDRPEGFMKALVTV